MKLAIVTNVCAVYISTVTSLKFTSPAFSAVSSRERFTIAWEDNSGPVMIKLRGSNGGSASSFPILWTIDSKLLGRLLVAII